jgi:hypothetical protein
MPLSPQWCHALETLIAAGLSGVTDAELMAHGFSAEMMASLVLSGEHVRMRITTRAGGDRMVDRAQTSPVRRSPIQKSQF